MMQFLTKILSKNKDNNKSLEDLRIKKEIQSLRAEIENHKKIFEQYNNALRDFALANEVLCTEVTMIGKWVTSKIKEGLGDDSEFSRLFGGVDSDDDEYLN